MRTALLVSFAILTASAAQAQITTQVVGKQPVYVNLDVVPASSVRPPLADLWPRTDAIVHLRITRTLPARPQPQPDGGRMLCTGHDAAIIEVLKPHPVEGPTGERFQVLQESAGFWEGLKGHAPFPEGTEFIAFLTWRPTPSRFAFWLNPLAVVQGRVVRQDPRDNDPLFMDVPRGIPVEDFLAKLRALAKDQR
jgi:hypothetical protein